MSVRQVAPGRVLPSTGPAGGAHLAARPPVVGERLAYLDNLKTLLIAGIIASHAVMGYATFGSWTYQDVQEVTLSDAVEKIYAILFLILGGLFLTALFFLVSGLLTQARSSARARLASSRIDSCGWACPSPSTR